MVTGLLLPNITYLSCPLCHGAREIFDKPCNRCSDPDIGRLRWMLPRLTVDQIDMIRFFEHTLAEQPFTNEERKNHRCEYFVEDEQTGELDIEDGVGWLVPPDRYWFASGRYSSGPCGNGGFFQFNATGLLLRECLMTAATAIIPHMYPPRSETNERPQS